MPPLAYFALQEFTDRVKDFGQTFLQGHTKDFL